MTDRCSEAPQIGLKPDKLWDCTFPDTSATSSIFWTFWLRMTRLCCTEGRSKSRPLPLSSCVETICVREPFITSEQSVEGLRS